METRSIKELLQFTLNEGNVKFKNERAFGLCGFIRSLAYSNKISTEEWYLLMRFIDDNRPPKGSVHYRPSQSRSGFYWKVGSWNPRKEWLKDQIELQ